MHSSKSFAVNVFINNDRADIHFDIPHEYIATPMGGIPQPDSLIVSRMSMLIESVKGKCYEDKMSYNLYINNDLKLTYSPTPAN